MEISKKSFKELNLKTNGRIFGFGTSPDADWKIIFGITLILTVFVISMSVYVFIMIDKGEIFVVEKSSEQEGQTIDVAALKETVFYYQEKMREFEKSKDQVVPAVDPSL